MGRDNRGTVGFVVRVTSQTLGEWELAEFMATVWALMILGGQCNGFVPQATHGLWQIALKYLCGVNFVLDVLK